jgi:LmbE family N-acetylglucosaminyl deacetylase
VVTFDSATRGTAAAEWSTLLGSAPLPALDLTLLESLAVVAAHPDDETLGAGGLINECAVRGIPVQVIVVTDGAASHPGSRTASPGQIAVVRQRELFLAIAELGPRSEVVTLGFDDGQTAGSRGEIARAIARQLDPRSTLVAPWRGDGHRDHRVVAEICAELAARRDARLFEYPIWMWHWASPRDERVPWQSGVRVPLSHIARAAKRRAIDHYSSQVTGVGPADADGPVLSAQFLAHFERDEEVFYVR